MRLALVASVALLAAAAAGAQSPQGRIVFTADQAPKVSGDVYRLDANGRRVDLTRTAYRESSPEVAPRGGHVAYTSERDGRISVSVVGLDGRGATRVTPWTALFGSTDLVWAPDGVQLAVLQGTTIYLARAGTAARPIASGPVVGAPAWSPDGRLVTFTTGAYPNVVVQAVTPSGRREWRVPQTGGTGGWSSQGLYAAPHEGTTTVYASDGRPVFRFAARVAAWSPDGLRLASVVGDRVEVRDTRGELRFRRRVTGVQSVGWIGDGSVVAGGVPTGTGALLIDLASGRTRELSLLVWIYGSRGAYPVARGAAFAIRLGKRTFGNVPACMSDGARVPAISNLQAVPGKRSVVYASECDEPFANLYSVSPSGGAPKRLAHAAQQQGSVSLSPDGTRIAYTGAPATGLSCKGCPQTIWVAHADGTRPRELTEPQDCSYDGSPSWSPDGTTILFARSTCDSFGTLLTVPATGGAPRDLHVAGRAAAWGPDQLAWVSESATWRGNADGSNRRRLAGPNGSFAPAWSRDGRLAISQGRHGVTIFAGGAGQEVVLPFAQVASLAWSPDGTRLAVAARPDGGATFDVFTLRPNGTDVRRLTYDVDALSVGWR